VKQSFFNVTLVLQMDFVF